MFPVATIFDVFPNQPLPLFAFIANSLADNNLMISNIIIPNLFF